MGTRDQLVLGDTVMLRLSGKRYMAEPTSPHLEIERLPMPADATTVTRRQR